MRSEHAIGRVSFRDNPRPETASYQTSYDALTAVVDGKPYFMGSASQALYGGPVPLAENSPSHSADNRDLMFPVTLAGDRGPSIADLALLSDLGVPLATTFGTVFADTISSEPRGGEIFAGFGGDTVSGRAGEDTLHGGPGDDSIRGGKSDDVLFGDGGSDTIGGDIGNDTLIGGPGSDLFLFGDNCGSDVTVDFYCGLGDANSDRLQFTSTPTITVDYESYSTRFEAAGTTVTLLNTITVLPDMWAVGVS
jgi:Ca2+-binding RTX toxin-like protein